MVVCSSRGAHTVVRPVPRALLAAVALASRASTQLGGSSWLTSALCDEPLLSTNTSQSTSSDTLSVVVGETSGGGTSAGDSYGYPTHRPMSHGYGCGSGDGGPSCGRQHRTRRNGILTIRGRRNGVLNLRRRRNGVLETEVASPGRGETGANPRSALTSPCCLNATGDSSCEAPDADALRGRCCCSCRRARSDTGDGHCGENVAVVIPGLPSRHGALPAGDGGARLGSAPGHWPTYCEQQEQQRNQNAQHPWRQAVSGPGDDAPRGGGHDGSFPAHDPCSPGSLRHLSDEQGRYYAADAVEGLTGSAAGLSFTRQPHAVDCSVVPGAVAAELAEAACLQPSPPPWPADRLPLSNPVTAAVALPVASQALPEAHAAASGTPLGRRGSRTQRPQVVVVAAAHDGASPLVSPPAGAAGGPPPGRQALQAPWQAGEGALRHSSADARSNASAAGAACEAGADPASLGLETHSRVDHAAAGEAAGALEPEPGASPSSPRSPAARRPTSAVGQLLPSSRPGMRRAHSLAALTLPPAHQPDLTLPALPQHPTPLQHRLFPHPPLGLPRERPFLPPTAYAGPANRVGPASPSCGLQRSVSSLPAAGAAPQGTGRELSHPHGGTPLGDGGGSCSPALAVTGTAVAVFPRPPARAWQGGGAAASQRGSIWSTATSLLSDVLDVPEEEQEGERCTHGAGAQGLIRAPSRRVLSVVLTDAALLARSDGMGDASPAATADTDGGAHASPGQPRFAAAGWAAAPPHLCSPSAATAAQPGAGLLLQAPALEETGTPSASADTRRTILAPLPFDSAALHAAAPPLRGPGLRGRVSAAEPARPSHPLCNSWPARDTDGAGLGGLVDPLLAAAAEAATAREPASGTSQSPLGRSPLPAISPANSSVHTGSVQQGNGSRPTHTINPRPPFVASPVQGAGGASRAGSEGGAAVAPTGRGDVGAGLAARLSRRDAGARAASEGSPSLLDPRLVGMAAAALPRIAGACGPPFTAGR